MADEEREENRPEEEEEDDWAEPVDLADLPNGPTTTFVGGFSSVKSVGELLQEKKCQPGDDIVILPGAYKEDMRLDTTKLRGVNIRGDGESQPGTVVFDGRLLLEYSEPPPKQDDADDVDAPPPVLLSVSHLTFLKGAEYGTQTAANVDDCVFGTSTGDPQVPNGVLSHGFSTVTTSNSTIFGSDKSALYCFPVSRTTFVNCEVTGAEKPPPEVEPERQIRKRGTAPPPPPPPTVPVKCECSTGIYLDDASVKFNNCRISNFDIGVLARDVCTKGTFNECSVSMISTVGFHLDAKCTVTLRKSAVKMCGRECLVVGKEAHPTVRDNVFVGDVRLKDGCVATGVTDNVLALNGNLYNEDVTFAIKGWTVVEGDPTIVKPKKIRVDDE